MSHSGRILSLRGTSTLLISWPFGGQGSSEGKDDDPPPFGICFGDRDVQDAGPRQRVFAGSSRFPSGTYAQVAVVGAKIHGHLIAKARTE